MRLLSLRRFSRGTVVHLALLVVTAGCGHTRSSRVSDSTFVLTMAELERIQTAPSDSLDSAARAARRKAVLQRRGLQPEQLENAARAIARSPRRAAAIWKAVEDHARTSTNIDRRIVAPPGAGVPGSVPPDADSARRADSLALARDTAD